MVDTDFREIDPLVRDLTIQALEMVIKNLQDFIDAPRPFPDFSDIPKEEK